MENIKNRPILDEKRKYYKKGDYVEVEYHNRAVKGHLISKPEARTWGDLDGQGFVFKPDNESGTLDVTNQDVIRKINPFEEEFYEYLEGDPSVGIPESTPEQARDILLEHKEYQNPKDRRLIEELVREANRNLRLQGRQERTMYRDWKKENPEEYRESVKWNRSYAQKRRWEKLKTNRGQGGYFRHRREHSINARKRRR